MISVRSTTKLQMEYNMICIYAILIGTQLIRCEAMRRNLEFTKAPTEGPLDGLGCAIESHLTARGVKFDTQTATCDALTDAWFSTQILESNNYYYRLVMAELALEPTVYLSTTVPVNFKIGSSIVLYLKTAASLNDITVEIENTARSYLVFHMRTYMADNEIVFNSRDGTVWGTEQYKTNIFTATNALYKVELRIVQSLVEVRVNDSLLHNFGHRTSTANYQQLVYRSSLV